MIAMGGAHRERNAISPATKWRNKIYTGQIHAFDIPADIRNLSKTRPARFNFRDIRDSQSTNLAGL